LASHHLIVIVTPFDQLTHGTTKKLCLDGHCAHVLLRPGSTLLVGRHVLRILNAKAGFALYRPQTILKGRELAIGGATGKIRAPLTDFLIVLCLCAIDERASSNNKDRNRY
jgi:hypothetical protein